jgi:predicted nucleotidyltransferase
MRKRRISKDTYYRAVDEITQVCSNGLKKDIVALYLIGSVAKGDFKPGKSDLDFELILTDNADPKTIFDFSKIVYSIIEKYGLRKHACIHVLHEYEIDLINKFHPSVYHSVEGLYELKEYGKLLLGKNILDKFTYPPPEQMKGIVICQMHCIRRYYYPWIMGPNSISKDLINNPDKSIVQQARALMDAFAMLALITKGIYEVRKSRIKQVFVKNFREFPLIKFYIKKQPTLHECLLFIDRLCKYTYELFRASL